MTDEGIKNTELTCQIKRNFYCYSCKNATEKCYRKEIGCPCGKYESYKDENAKLKEKLNQRSCQNCKRYNRACPNDGSCNHYSKWEGYENSQLTKAKEIIKRFSEFVNNEIEYDPEHPQEHTDLWNKLCEEAEQFLKEDEE